MRILLEAHHPAHVHFWKYPVRELRERGHEVLMVGRDRDVMRRLLEIYDWIPCEIPPRSKGGNRFPMAEMFRRQRVVAGAIRRFKPDVVASLMGSYTQSARLFGVRNLIFTDSEFQHFNHRIAHPFADEVHTPECFYKDLGRKQRRYNSIHELGFLDSRRFKADTNVLERYQLEPEAFAIIRLSAWNTLHDVSQEGIGEAIYDFVEQHGRSCRLMLVAEEGKVPPGLENLSARIQPEDFHSVLAFARFVLSEGASTASEAACLGVPTVYVNSTEPRGYLTMLQENYGVVEAFREAAPGVARADAWLTAIGSEGGEWGLASREAFRQRLSVAHVDLAAHVVSVLESADGAAT